MEQDGQQRPGCHGHDGFRPGVDREASEPGQAVTMARGLMWRLTMKIDISGKFSRPFWALLALFCFSAAVFAQSGNGSLTGQVTDPSGAAIPAATVTLTGPGQSTKTAQTDEQGRYTFKDLAPGAYSVAISTQGFSTFTKADIQVAQDQASGEPSMV